jgi:hypothetical protein
MPSDYHLLQSVAGLSTPVVVALLIWAWWVGTWSWFTALLRGEKRPSSSTSKGGLGPGHAGSDVFTAHPGAVHFGDKPTLVICADDFG